MTRFFFHMREDGHLVRDEEGMDLPNVAAARKEALHQARDVLAEAISGDEPRARVVFEFWTEAEFVEEVGLNVVLGDRSGS